MKQELFREETIYSVGDSKLVENSYEMIKNAIRNNHAVGFVTGHYDENLTITNVSGFLLHNLGYDYEEFMEITKGSLKNLFYGENKSFLENGRFQKIQGEGEGMILMKGNTPAYVRLFKKDSVDKNGEPMWILSARMDWMQQNLQLVNRVIQSGFWVIDCDENGEPITASYSHEFRRMLGYRDTLDFPNTLEAWTRYLHPDDKDQAVKQLSEALQDKTNQTKYNVEYRMKMADGTYQWFRDSAEVTRRLDGTACRMAGIFINIQKEKEAEEAKAKSKAMDLLIQGTVKLVDRYAMCDLEHNTYKFYNRNSDQMVYKPIGNYDEFVDVIASKFKLLTDEMSLQQAFSKEHI